MTQRKPVKKAAKKAVKKPLTMKILDGKIADLYDSLSEDKRSIQSVNERVGLLRKDSNDFFLKISMAEAGVKAHDKFYDEIRDIKTSIWWTKFWLALTITAFVAYAIITA